MASAIQPCILGELLSNIHGRLKAEPTKPGLKELALKTLAQVETQRSSWCEAESQEFYSTYSGIVEDLTKLTVKPEAAVNTNRNK